MRPNELLAVTPEGKLGMRGDSKRATTLRSKLPGTEKSNQRVCNKKQRTNTTKK